MSKAGQKIREALLEALHDEVITYTVLNPEPGRRTSIEYASYIIAGLREHDAPDEYLAYVKKRVIANNPNLAAQMRCL